MTGSTQIKEKHTRIIQWKQGHERQKYMEQNTKTQTKEGTKTNKIKQGSKKGKC